MATLKKQRVRAARELRKLFKDNGVAVSLPESLKLVKVGLMEADKLPDGVELDDIMGCECCGPDWVLFFKAHNDPVRLPWDWKWGL